MFVEEYIPLNSKTCVRAGGGCRRHPCWGACEHGGAAGAGVRGGAAAGGRAQVRFYGYKNRARYKMLTISYMVV